MVKKIIKMDQIMSIGKPKIIVVVLSSSMIGQLPKIIVKIIKNKLNHSLLLLGSLNVLFNFFTPSLNIFP